MPDVSCLADGWSAVLNGLLRHHVTRVGFDLTLTSQQIDALVQLDLAMKDGKRRPHVLINGRGPGPRDNTVGAVDGLIRRGLVIHHYKGPDSGVSQVKRDEYRTHFSITAAGRAVVVLLEEAGLYAEYAKPIKVTAA